MPKPRTRTENAPERPRIRAASESGPRARQRAGDNGQRPIRPPNPDDLISSQRARRDRIIDQAAEFLRYHEYEEIQMRDVADHAQVALGTVYRYFASKEHLFAAVLVRWGEALQGRVQRAPLRGSDVPAQLKDVYKRVYDAFERLPQYFRLMIVVETTTDSYARELYEEFSRAANLAMLEPLDALEPDAAASVSDVLNAVLAGGLRAWSLGRLPMSDARERMDRTIDLIFSSPPKKRSTRATSS